MCWTLYLLCFSMWADWAHWTVRKLCVGDGPFFSWWVFLVAHSTNCVGESDCTQLPPSNLLSWCKFSFDFITLHQFDPISYSLYFSNISNQWKIFRFLWPLIKTLQKNPWHFPLEFEMFWSLMPVACALTGDRIHWLMSLGTGLAGTQASFSCFSSGHLWAPFTVCLLNWSRTSFFTSMLEIVILCLH